MTTEKMELWVEREALEIVVMAAAAHTYGFSLEDWKQEKVMDAVKAINTAVEEACEDPLNTSPL